MNPALEQYIRENLAKGYSADDLAQAIRAQGGWSEEDIAAAFAAVERPSAPSVPAAPAIEMAQQTPTAAPASFDAPLSTSASEAHAGATPANTGAWSDSSAPKEHDPNAGGWHGSVEEFAEINARKRRVLGIAGLSAAVIVLAAVGGYLSIQTLRVTPEEALLQSLVAMGDINSTRYHATGTMAIELTPQGEMVEQMAMLVGGGEKAKVKFEFAIDGAIELLEGSTTMKHQRMDMSLSGDGSAGPFQVALGGKVGLVQIPPDSYLTFVKMPKFMAFLDLTFLEGRTLHLTAEDLESAPGAGDALDVLSATGSPSMFEPKFDVELLSEEKREQLGELYRTHAPLVIVESEEKIALGDKTAREFTIRMDRAAFDRFIAEAKVIAPEFTEGADKPESKEALDVLASTTVKFQVEEKSYFLRSMVLNMPIATSTPEFLADATLTLSMTLDGINEPVVVAPPANALRKKEFEKSIEEALEKDPRILEVNPFLVGMLGGMSEANTKAKDAKRLSAQAQFQLALELYYDTYGQYPTTLEALVPMYLPKIPVEPEEVQFFVYVPLKSKGSTVLCDGKAISCQYYALGASIEDQTHAGLKTDADAYLKGIKGFSGSDLAGCRGERELSCYDVSP